MQTKAQDRRHPACSRSRARSMNARSFGAIDAVRAHAQALLGDLGAWEGVSRATDFDAA